MEKVGERRCREKIKRNWREEVEKESCLEKLELEKEWENTEEMEKETGERKWSKNIEKQSEE